MKDLTFRPLRRRWGKYQQRLGGFAGKALANASFTCSLQLHAPGNSDSNAVEAYDDAQGKHYQPGAFPANDGVTCRREHNRLWNRTNERGEQATPERQLGRAGHDGNGLGKYRYRSREHDADPRSVGQQARIRVVALLAEVAQPERAEQVADGEGAAPPDHRQSRASCHAERRSVRKHYEARRNR